MAHRSRGCRRGKTVGYVQTDWPELVDMKSMKSTGRWYGCWLVGAALMFPTGCNTDATKNTAAGTSDETAQASAPPRQAQKAVAGVGQAGSQLQEHSDAQKLISGPASQLLQFRQKAVLEIQVPQALQLFRATEGRWPNSHEEFMEKIVRANRLNLPELPPGMVYRFNVEKGELWVYPEDQAP
ncbi:MAG: hypothetical protein D6753_11225 [Planctomycetota bacterium]|nr:MAG: hypothetical protein D6753_11225 [Planctomycetota bacterium]